MDTDCAASGDNLAIWGWKDEENNRYIVLYFVQYRSSPDDTYLYEVILNGDDNSITYHLGRCCTGR